MRASLPLTTAVTALKGSPYLRLLRPRQWAKNLFVLAAPLFGHSLVGEGGALRLDQFALLGGAFAAFCALSGAIYVLNDVFDAEADRKHPVKRHRPIASGEVRPSAALGWAGVLIAVSASLAVAVGVQFGLILLAYLANSLSYFLFFKRKVVSDVLSIAVGFMLRILGGAVAVGVSPSSWLMICGFSIAIFLGFSKRRSEIELYLDGESAALVRSVFGVYTREKLNLLCAVTAAISIVTYMLYTVSPETIATHRTEQLIYTSPFVVYCVLRFLLKAMEVRGEDAAETIFADKGFLAAGLGWAASVVWILYGQGPQPIG
jgi:4-hydroxybenzoate polyprenyltransferase